MVLWDLENILKYQKDEESFFVLGIYITIIFIVTRAINKTIDGNYLNKISIYSLGNDGVNRIIKISNINTPNNEDNLTNIYYFIYLNHYFNYNN